MDQLKITVLDSKNGFRAVFVPWNLIFEKLHLLLHSNGV